MTGGDLSDGVGNLAAEILPAELRYVLHRAVWVQSQQLF